MKKLSILLFALAFFASNIYGTIHKEDYSTSSISFPTYFDIDNDGNHDFYFEVWGTDIFRVYSSNSNSYFAAEGSDTLVSTCKAYDFGSGMGTYHWYEGSGLLASNNSGGYFTNQTKYLMVKFKDTNSNTYYGWFRIRGTTSSLIVYSFAYSDVPNEMIGPGETEVTASFDWNSSSTAGLIEFDNYSQPTQYAPLTYTWDFGDGGISTDENPDHTYSANGNYNACLTATSTFGRSDTFCDEVQITGITVGVKTPEDVLMQLMPNPANNWITIETGKWKVAKVEIIDMNGKVQFQYLPTLHEKLNFDISPLFKGVYTCKLTGMDGKVIIDNVIKN